MAETIHNDQSVVLVTGASGYIGGRLVPVLIRKGYRVRVLVRDRSRIEGRDWAGSVEIHEGDLQDPVDTAHALKGIDTAYFLVHSMQAGADFAERDRRITENFIAAGKQLKHVIYIGGLLPVSSGSASSAHLQSRGEVGEALRNWLPVTEFRAGPVIGSGSASFEMVRYLTERLPIMVAPRWITNQIQCIGIRDMLNYLVAALDVKPAGVVEIGSDPLTFREMMQQYADVRGLKRLIVAVPVLTPGLAAEWIQFVTPISRNIAVPIVKGMVYPLLADTKKAQRLFSEIKPDTYRKSVEMAVSRVTDQRVTTHWSGARGAQSPSEKGKPVCPASDVRSQFINRSPEAVFSVIRRLGGDAGWLTDNWIWRMRGLLDKLIGGPGLLRGRRDPVELLAGDSVDFWRVEAIRSPALLRLRAEMKLPGTAWLQWEVVPEGVGSRLVQSALFAPAGMAGRLYWNLLKPIHNLVFGRLAAAIANRATAFSGKGQSPEVKPVEQVI